MGAGRPWHRSRRDELTVPSRTDESYGHGSSFLRTVLPGEVSNKKEALVAIATITPVHGEEPDGIVLTLYVGRKASRFTVDIVLAVYVLGMTVFTPLVSLIADVTGRHPFVPVSTGTIATAVAVLLMVAESNVEHNLGSRYALRI